MVWSPPKSSRDTALEQTVPVRVASMLRLLIALSLLIPLAATAQGDPAGTGAKASATAPKKAADSKAAERERRRSRRAKRKAARTKKAAPTAEAPKDTASKAEAAPKSTPKASAGTKAASGKAKSAVAGEKALPSDRVPPKMRAASANGAMGLDRVMSADPGPQGTLRLRGGFTGFTTDSWPNANTKENSFSSTTFSLSYTPIEALETFVNVRSTSNTNNNSRPSLLQTQGDMTLGAKGGTFVTETIAVGGAAMVHLLSGLGEGGLAGSATSYELRALSTFDWTRKAEGAIPLRLLVDFSYYFENAEATFDGQPGEPDLIQEWGLQAYRYDRLTLGLGLEAPISPYVSPFLEYRLGTPFLVELERQGEDSPAFSFASVPHTVTPGVRVFPLPELAIDLALRIGLSDSPYTGVVATPPWELAFGLSYTLDPRPKVIERTIKADAPPPPPPPAAPKEGQIGGLVVDADGKPVEGAQIIYDGLSTQLSDAQGRYTSYKLPKGTTKVRIVANGFKPAEAKAKITEGGTTQLKTALVPMGKGRFEIKAFGANGKALKAKILIGGGAELSGTATRKAAFTGELNGGTYPVTLKAKGYPKFERRIEIKPGKLATLQVTLSKPGKAARRSSRSLDSGGLVSLKGKRFVFKRRIRFTGETSKLTGGSTEVVAALAAFLRSHPEIKKIKVSAHTAGRGDRAKKMTLSRKQALSVKSFLSRRGVAKDRVVTRGYGPDKPIAPNLTARGRAKNQRVEITVESGR